MIQLSEKGRSDCTQQTHCNFQQTIAELAAFTRESVLQSFLFIQKRIGRLLQFLRTNVCLRFAVFRSALKFSKFNHTHATFTTLNTYILQATYYYR